MPKRSDVTKETKQPSGREVNKVTSRGYDTLKWDSLDVRSCLGRCWLDLSFSAHLSPPDPTCPHPTSAASLNPQPGRRSSPADNAQVAEAKAAAALARAAAGGQVNDIYFAELAAREREHQRRQGDSGPGGWSGNI